MPPAPAPLDLAVLVVSCDGYRDLWTPFFHLFRRFWPRCPFPVFLLCNREAPEIEGVTVLAVGEDRSWSDNLLEALARIDSEYVLLFLEDLFLHGPVPEDRMGEALAWIRERRPHYLRLNPSEGPNGPCDGVAGVVLPGAPYRTSTVVPVWRRETLAALLKPGESAWQFEVEGSVRSDAFDGFYSTWRELLPLTNGVIKGTWRPSALRRLRALGAPVDLEGRKAMSPLASLAFALVQARHALFRRVPWRARRRLRALFTWGGRP